MRITGLHVFQCFACRNSYYLSIKTEHHEDEIRYGETLCHCMFMFNDPGIIVSLDSELLNSIVNYLDKNPKELLKLDMFPKAKHVYRKRKMWG